jgi:RNA polymerase sigma-70 factor (ECF subfamily)
MSIPLARPIAMESPPRSGSEPGAAEVSGRELERALLAELRAGRPGAAERLVEATYARLWAVGHRITGDPEDAADLVQETYRKAWTALGEFRGEASFSTWLFRIAWTTHLKRLRRPRLVVPLEPEREAAERAPDPTPEANAATRERDARLRRAVAQLPDPLRETVVAHYWAELPVRELALADGVTPMAIRKRLAKALRLLAAQLQGSNQETIR